MEPFDPIPTLPFFPALMRFLDRLTPVEAVLALGLLAFGFFLWANVRAGRKTLEQERIWANDRIKLAEAQARRWEQAMLETLQERARDSRKHAAMLNRMARTYDTRAQQLREPDGSATKPE